jgi:hypothetical protein
VLFSSGIGAQVNLAYGPLYFFISPVGFEVRYLGIATQNGTSDNLGSDSGSSSNNVATEVDLGHRLRFGIGFQY